MLRCGASRRADDGTALVIDALLRDGRKCSMRRPKVFRALRSLAMAVALMVFCVAQVRADPGDQDQAVINLFTSQGIPYTSGEKVRIWGQTVCQHLRAGQSISDVTIGEMLGNPKESGEQARQAVLDAWSVYCPEVAPGS
jgi:hypothetical protein